MIAISGLCAQVRAQIVGEAVVAVEGDGGVAMHFRLIQRAGHSLGGGEIEQILRYVGAACDRAQEKLPRLLM
jgi:hypothetical protein